MTDNIKVLARNRRANHEYFIEDKIEAGIVLKGTEVKSIREGYFNFKDSYVRVKNGECWLIGFHISPYKNAGYAHHEPDGERKLLLKKMEIRRLQKELEQQGYTVVPLTVYLKRGLVKIEIGLAKGKKLYDKRHDIRDRDLNREMQRAGKNVKY